MKKAWQHKRAQATKTALAHFTLNAAVPSFDMVTDFLTGLNLISKGHVWWGLATILCMFLPFAMKVGMLISESIMGKARLRHLASVVLSIPFVNPLKQTLMAIRLAMLDPTKKKNTKKIEAVVKDASLNSLYEAILEAGPQILIQMHVVLSTGEISTIQAISMGSSLFTITLAASRGFYVQRPKKYADPEPSLQMIFWVFLPMLILVVSAVVNWSVVGLVKEYIVLIFSLCVAVTWFALWVAKKCGRRMKIERKEEEIEMTETETKKNEEIAEEPAQVEKGGKEEVREEEKKMNQDITEGREVDKKGKTLEKNKQSKNEQENKTNRTGQEEERNPVKEIEKEKEIKEEDPKRGTSNSEENHDESSKLIDIAQSRPDEVVVTMEEELQAGSTTSTSVEDSKCNRIKTSFSGCFSFIGQIPSSISACFTCEPGKKNGSRIWKPLLVLGPVLQELLPDVLLWSLLPFQEECKGESVHWSASMVRR